MPFVSIAQSDLVPGAVPVSIHYREAGSGRPLVFLHGAWGYQIYPFDAQIAAFGSRFRILIPDRSGYGGSSRIPDLPVDFHRRAAEETIRWLDAMQIDRPVLWGHSDGAVIAALIGIQSPERISAVILEAFHLWGRKPRSRAFFERMLCEPEQFGDRICSILRQDHGEDSWRDILRMGGAAWLRLAGESATGDDDAGHDLYDGMLAGLGVPALFIHGSGDPRSEPGELAAVATQLPNAQIELVAAGHAPHSQASIVPEVNRVAEAFLSKLF